MENLLDNLKTLLQKDERLVGQGGLLKNIIIELALKIDKDLIKLLLSDKEMKKVFFIDVDGPLVFDKDKFMRFVSNKQFLPDSYTAFKNKIGLTLGDDYLSEKKEVVLSWPYKDCVLEGGMTKEDQKRDEIFWNEILAPDEISRLFDPKVFTNAKRIDKKDEHKLNKFKTDENGNIKDNLIVKGNNLLALQSLKKRFAGKVKLIYIDPPYNTRNDSFKYNDSFNHSTWLTFMKNRLEAAREILREDGVIFVSCDDNEQAYLKVLCDEVFRRNNFVANFTIRSNPRGSQASRFLAVEHEYIIFYAKNIDLLDIKGYEKSEKEIKEYTYTDHDGRKYRLLGLRQRGGAWRREHRPNMFFPIYVNPKTGEVSLNRSSIFSKKALPKRPSGEEGRWTWSKDKVEKNKHLLIGKKVNRIGEDDFWDVFRIDYLEDITGDKAKKKPTTIWLDKEVNYQNGRNEMKELFGSSEVFEYPKPSFLIKKCIRMFDGKDTIILDFFAGSGTTAQAVLELNKEDSGNRQFILCEQLEYVDAVTMPRVKKVIKKLGGGDFIYLELMKWNENFVERIQKAKTKDELAKLWEAMKKKAFLSYKVDIKAVDENAKDFADLSIEDQKRFLLECLDKNHLYVNYSEIDDEEYGVSEENKKLNREFYGNR